MTKYGLIIFTTLFFIYSFNINAQDLKIENKNDSLTVRKFCDNINKEFKRYKWRKIVCNPFTWIWEEKWITAKGNPLLYQIFNRGIPETTTLFICGVHGDELPAFYQCVHLVRDILFDNPNDYKNSKIIVAPFVNPDGFLLKRPTRQNGRGVDINRNFPTKDFNTKAISNWKKKYKSSPRKYPGPAGASEVETQFQIMLISRFNPDKIISIHSPYGWLDIDTIPRHDPYMDEPDDLQYGPFRTLFDTSRDIGKEMSKKSNNFPVTNFRIYPGSLGNYAAHERKIPTYTLELATSNAYKAHEYWNRMHKAYSSAISYIIPKRFAKKRENIDEKQKIQ